MNYWRMSFRVGNHGYEMWPLCFEHHVAAISYEPIDDLDLSEWAYGEPAEKWSQLWPSQKASIRRVAYEMRKGDVIYVKQGPRLVGCGEVLGRYQYRFSGRITDRDRYLWPHQVPVNWKRDFTPVDVLLGGEQNTVLRLTGNHLRLIRNAEAPIRQAILTAEASEGALVQAYVKFRQRNRSLIDAKRAQCASHMECEICGFSFQSFYGSRVKEVLDVHHRNPLAEQKGVVVTKIGDLALLCPNCHRALHSVRPPMTIEDLRAVVG